MNARQLSFAASASLLALIGLCVLWEAVLAPLRPGGSWLVLKAVPLLLPLFGILRGKRYTYQWTTMLVLLYFTEGVVRAADGGMTGWLAAAEIVLSLTLFLSAMLYARITAPSRRPRA